MHLHSPQFVFDMDLCDGNLFRFSSRSPSASSPLIDGLTIDFNLSQRVPFQLEKADCRVPRDNLLASLASPAVSVATKALLVQLLSPEDMIGVFVLEKR